MPSRNSRPPSVRSTKPIISSVASSRKTVERGTFRRRASSAADSVRSRLLNSPSNRRPRSSPGTMYLSWASSGGDSVVMVCLCYGV